MSNFRALELWTTIRPRTDAEPPKYSATMAPIRLSVEASLSAVKRYGSEFGIRTLRMIAPSLAAYERISSSELGSTPDRPRVMFAITGKNDRTAAIIILDSGLSEPNQALNSGAKAMIGIAPAATASGSITERIPAQRVASSATTTPAVTPMTNPPTASKSVDCADFHSGNRSPFQLSISADRIAEGAGRMKARSWRLRTIASHRTSPAIATTTAGRYSRARRADRAAVPGSDPRRAARRCRSRRSPDGALGEGPARPTRPRPRHRPPGRPRGAPRGPR